MPSSTDRFELLCRNDSDPESKAVSYVRMGYNGRTDVTPSRHNQLDGRSDEYDFTNASNFQKFSEES